MPKRLLLPRSQVVGLDGRPIAGAKLETYVTGTSTPKAVYTDAGLSVAHSNPVVADALGMFPAMFLASGDYRTILKDEAGSVIATDDPVEGDTAASDTDVALAGLAASRNRIINPAMMLSQDNGTTAVDATTGNSYVIDQWYLGLSSSPGGTLRGQQVAAATPGGSPYRLRMTAQATDTSLASGDYYGVFQPIEGVMVPDARFGASAARDVLLRFGVRSSIAGTFTVSLRNATPNRSYLATFTIASGEVNSDVVRTFTIPGDTSGTWATDSSAGMIFGICLGAGSTFQGAAGWQAGNLLAISGQTNFMATSSATLDLLDVGLYVDALDLGVSPPWQLPGYADELLRCQRYYYKATSGTSYPTRGVNYSGSTVGVSIGAPHPVKMRAAPTMSFAWEINDVSQGSAPATVVSSADSWMIINDVPSGETLDITTAAASARL